MFRLAFIACLFLASLPSQATAQIAPRPPMYYQSGPFIVPLQYGSVPKAYYNPLPYPGPFSYPSTFGYPAGYPGLPAGYPGYPARPRVIVNNYYYYGTKR